LSDRLQDIAVLDDVVEIVVTGDLASQFWLVFIRPETVPPRDYVPLLCFVVFGVDIVAFDIWKLCCGLIQFV
jgi:hypothetical protein